MQRSGANSFAIITQAKPGLTFLIVSVLLFPSLALAHSCTSASRDLWLPKEKIAALIASMGYTHPGDLVIRGSCYELRAMSNEGHLAEVLLNPETGTVMRARLYHMDQDGDHDEMARNLRVVSPEEEHPP